MKIRKRGFATKSAAKRLEGLKSIYSVVITLLEFKKVNVFLPANVVWLVSQSILFSNSVIPSVCDELIRSQFDC
jgi:hypothetical protein